MKKRINELIIAAIVLSLLLVSGQQGCQLPGLPSRAVAEKTGLDFSLVSGIGYLTAGKTLRLDENFYVGVKIENYDKEARSGVVCIRDTIDDSFGGVREECKPFNVRAAETAGQGKKGLFIEKETEKVVPGSVELYFPEAGEYSYYGIPEMLRPYPSELQISLRYVERTLASGTLTIPDAQQPSIVQEPAPIAISVTKSIRKMQNAYKVDLEIMLRKQQDAKIFAPDFSQENATYFSAALEPQMMECKTEDGKPVTGLIEFKNARLIKCFSLVSLAAKEESYPLIITLNYGVAIERSYPFSIKTQAE